MLWAFCVSIKKGDATIFTMYCENVKAVKPFLKEQTRMHELRRKFVRKFRI